MEENNTMSKIEIQIPFSGFYESLHDSFIDDAVDEHFNYNHETGEDIELDDKFYDAKWSADIDWGKIHQGYAKAYVGEFGDKFGLDLEFAELTSPREYNFSTDRIFAKISEEQLNKLRKEVEAHKKWADCIREKFTSYDGFSSNYSNDSEDEEWTAEVLDECQYGVMLDFWIEHISDESEEWDCWLMDDYRSGGELSELVYPAAEAIIEYQKEQVKEDAVKDIKKAIEWIDDEYKGEHNMPSFAYEAIQELKEAIKKLEEK
jgi:hypothetical protein